MDGSRASDASGPDGRVDTPVAPVECAPALHLPIHVRDFARVERRGSPVSGGIPLARGELFEDDLERLALIDSEGAPVPSFQRPVILGRWNDGSIKWLLLDFRADVPAGGETTYTLCRVEEVGRASGIDVEEESDELTIDTGVLRAVVSKRRFGLLERVWLDRDGDGSYTDDELVVDGPGEMFVDLDDDAPPPDPGVYEYPSETFFGMEGGNWLRESVSDDATRYRASEGDYEVSVFREGRAHTVLRLAGWHRAASGRDFARYTLHLHFYAGQSYVRASHTWIMTGDPSRNFVRRMGIELPFSPADGALRYAAGGPFESPGDPVHFIDGEPPYVPLVPGPSEVHAGAIDAGGSAGIVSIGAPRYYHDAPLERDTRVPYAVLEDGLEVGSGHSASGWLDIGDGAVGLAAGVRDFWREHPKEVRYHDGRMTVFLWPDHGDRVLDLRRRYDEIRGVASDLGRAARREFGPAGSAVGLAKTTDVLFAFHEGDHLDASVDDTFRDFSEPLRPFVSPEHNVATGVLGHLRPRDDASFPRTERYLELTLAWPLRSAEAFGWHGMLDYGDHLIEYESIDWELPVPANWSAYANWGYGGWMQEAYRLGPALFVEYLRTGRHAYFREGDVWLRHHRDVDGVHWDTPDDGPRPNDNDGGLRLGGGHRHDQQHWGGYLVGYGIPTIATTHHYFLTGDGRDLEVLRENAEWILEHARIENHGRYAVLYMAEALDDPSLIERALAREVTPGVAFGRLTYDSGMGLMLHDVQTEGAPHVRERLRAWAAQDDEAFAFVRAHLEAEERRGEHVDAIARDFASLFPDEDVRTRYFEWAPRTPTSFRDAFSADIMPDGPWDWPFRSIEHLIFDAGRGLGNNPSRQVFVAQLPRLMSTYPGDPE